MAPWPARVAESLRRARRLDCDPFVALQVQLSLTRVERRITQILEDESRFARGHHLRAARLAHANLLDEACRLAGVADLPTDPAVRRLMAEVELRSRGWDW